MPTLDVVWDSNFLFFWTAVRLKLTWDVTVRAKTKGSNKQVILVLDKWAAARVLHWGGIWATELWAVGAAESRGLRMGILAPAPLPT